MCCCCQETLRRLLLRRLLLRRQPLSPRVFMGLTRATTIYYSSPPLLQQPEEHFVCKNTHVGGWGSEHVRDPADPFLQGFVSISLSANSRVKRSGSRHSSQRGHRQTQSFLGAAGRREQRWAPGPKRPLTTCPLVTPGEQLRLESQDMDTDRQGIFKKRGRGGNCLEAGKRGLSENCRCLLGIECAG